MYSSSRKGLSRTGSSSSPSSSGQTGCIGPNWATTANLEDLNETGNYLSTRLLTIVLNIVMSLRFLWGCYHDTYNTAVFWQKCLSNILEISGFLV